VAALTSKIQFHAGVQSQKAGNQSNFMGQSYAIYFDAISKDIMNALKQKALTLIVLTSCSGRMEYG